jgi:serine/threonine-protein kinase
MALVLGQELGSYRIVEEIGAGGMATVYKAIQASLDRFVAVQVLPAASTSDPTAIQRFRQEAVVVARLRHPNILVVFDYGEQDGVRYLVSELIVGGTLADRMRGAGPMPVAEAGALLRPVAAALDFAHSQGVIHRDVKPHNVLITRDGTPILSDFGIARMVERDQRLTEVGVGLGTPEYVAPEQAMDGELGPACDVYALGVVAYELLTGTVPFTASTPMAVAMAHVQRPVPLPQARNPSIPDGVQAALLRALAKSPGDRQPSAGAFIAELMGESAPDAPARTAPQPGEQYVLRSQAGSIAPAVEEHSLAVASAAEQGPGTVSTARTIAMDQEPVAPRSARQRRIATPRALVGGVAAAALIAAIIGAVLILRGGSPADLGAEGADLASLSAVAVDATNDPTPPPSASAGTILYQDTFDTPLAGLLPKTSATPAEYERGYVDGEYQIKLLGGDRRSIAVAPIPGVHANVALSVDGRRVDAVHSGAIFLACRSQGDTLRSQYRFTVDTERKQFRLGRLDDGKGIALTEWTATPLLKGGLTQNRLELDCQGATIAASIDGQRVASVEDRTYGAGRLYIGLATTRAGEARFDNLRVVQGPNN